MTNKVTNGSDMPDDDHTWEREAEILVGRIARLTEQSDDLARRLCDTGIELEVARARVEQLEHLNAALHIELWQAQHKNRKKAVGAIAMVLAGVLAPFATGFSEGAGAAAWNDVRGIHEQSALVASRCDVPLLVLPDSAEEPVTVAPAGTATGQAEVGRPTVSTGGGGGFTQPFNSPFYTGGTQVEQPEHVEAILHTPARLVVHVNDEDAPGPDSDA